MNKLEEQRRIAITEKALKLTLKTAKKIGLTDKLLKPVLTIGRGEGAHAGIRRGKLIIKLSIHDRFHDVKAYSEMMAIKSKMYRLDRVWQKSVDHYEATGVARSVEYASIDKSPLIGGINTNDNWLVALCTACHEVAHVINDYYHIFQNKYNSRPRPHGIEWQSIYGELRRVLVNPYLYSDQVTEEQVKIAALTDTSIGSKRPKEGTTTGKVWLLADANTNLTRKEFIQLCVNEGISAGTASTQYSKWRKENG